MDLYVVSGGNHDPTNGPLYQDRLYINDGSSRFIHVPGALPQMHTSGGTVVPLDFDEDGDKDLFVGGRVLTGQYPLAPRSYLLENENGRFTDVTDRTAPGLANPGMVTDAVWADLDNDNQPELAIAGEWMPVRIFKKTNDNNLSEITDRAGLQHSSGWWNVLKAVDLNGDGHLELIAGNRGLNSGLETSPDAPVRIYADDFNDDGIVDPIISHVVNNKRYPLPGRDQLLQQLPNLKRRFPSYESYSEAAVSDVLTASNVDNAVTLEVYSFCFYRF
ncbi:MAG: VCBS repeat-containing protein [Balneolaceae bacterium]|nr:VCBS repeat-containing protein [Balneolaceae bacterium]